MPSVSSSSGILRAVTRREDGNMKHETARRNALAAAGLESRPLFFPSQKHGAAIVAVDAGSDPAVHPEADGLITSETGLVLGIFIADCMPIFVWEKSGKAAGVFHSGWRGTVAGMPGKAVRAFKERYGIGPKDLRAEIGPHIRSCCFRVGPDTAQQFKSSSVLKRGDELYVDLTKDAVAQMREAGMAEDAIRSQAATAPCTCCQPENYFSFRREKSDNRMMAFTALPGVRT